MRKPFLNCIVLYSLVKCCVIHPVQRVEEILYPSVWINRFLHLCFGHDGTAQNSLGRFSGRVVNRSICLFVFWEGGGAAEDQLSLSASGCEWLVDGWAPSNWKMLMLSFWASVSDERRSLRDLDGWELICRIVIIVEKKDLIRLDLCCGEENWNVSVGSDHENVLF